MGDHEQNNRHSSHKRYNRCNHDKTGWFINKTAVTSVTTAATMRKYDDSSQTFHHKRHKCHKRYNGSDDLSKKRHIISQISLPPYQEQKHHHKHYHKRHKRHKQPLRNNLASNGRTA